jgi:hypothetical protein
MRSALFLSLGLLALPAAAPAQIISGIVMETESKTRLPGGHVILLDDDSVAVAQFATDSVGAFSLTLPRAGAYLLRAELIGYRGATSPELNIGSRDTLQVEFSLARNAVVLEGFVVKARNRRLTPAAQRFYDRSRNSIAGSFIGRAQIDKVHPTRTTDLFRTIPGIQTTPMMGGNSVTIRGNCRPTVYVDGVRINGYRSIDDLAQPLELEGVEVYRSADQAPPEFTGLRAGCAVILIWTRIE